MKIYVASIEWQGGGEDPDIFADTTVAGAKRQALWSLTRTAVARSDMEEAQALFDTHPITESWVAAATDEEVDGFLTAMHDIATVPWVSIHAVTLENSASSDTDDGLGRWIGDTSPYEDVES